MKFNEVVGIIEEVKKNLTEEQKKRFSLYERDYNEEDYYHEIGGILGGSDEEEKQQLIFYIKPFDYPTPEVVDSVDLKDWYEDIVNSNEFADKHYDDSDLDKIDRGEYKFKSWEIISEWYNYEHMECQTESYDNAESVLNDINCFIENVEIYYGDLETV